jgi:predicted NAD/FAD-binding protein
MPSPRRRETASMRSASEGIAGPPRAATPRSLPAPVALFDTSATRAMHGADEDRGGRRGHRRQRRGRVAAVARARGSAVRARGALGGHTHTHRVVCRGASTRGHRLHRLQPAQLPLFTRLLAELGVDSQATTMGFSVQDARNGLEYNATSLDGLFCQRRNLLSPRFLRMVREILRFYREARRCCAGARGRRWASTCATALFASCSSRTTCADGLRAVVVADAEILRFPRSTWCASWPTTRCSKPASRSRPGACCGRGSASYLEAMQRDWRVQLRPGRRLRRVWREAGRRSSVGQRRRRRSASTRSCSPATATRRWRCSADPSGRPERGGASARCATSATRPCLHTDSRLLPRRRKAGPALERVYPRPRPVRRVHRSATA